MPQDETPGFSLHRLQPLERFSDRADDYARYRPSYPAAALDAIFAGLTTPIAAADIGAGTGISSRLLAERGAIVTAIEPNQAMRAAAIPHAGVVFRAGSAERTGLADACQHLLTCFQSFHWFEPVPCLAEFARILRAGGRLALVWNDRDERDGFTADYSALIRRVSSHHPATRRTDRKQSEAILTLLDGSGHFANTRTHAFASRQPLDLEALIGRVRSSSYIPLDEPVQTSLSADLKALHARWADASGLVYLVYRTQVFLCERR
ncbi:class I SAM-dependent methyltransferase [Gloeobacter morelensis]|uniref:Methyltransferase domain-containing protein n=1 Tax=Gloeobacter morelensis MG652769 TaxID=2781736 RepID=A0ABY3PT17_9CYAN|nr:class I SAM-dependent methyltransferase [Gloeobacter morelensis]UFP96659.1 methyltransferase domain-containing protein [Gloeobacter morelensis MG652769]